MNERIVIDPAICNGRPTVRGRPHHRPDDHRVPGRRDRMENVLACLALPSYPLGDQFTVLNATSWGCSRRSSAPLVGCGMTDAAPLMLTPRQTAERLGVGLGTLRKHAASVEALTGAPLPRGEHLERLWPESLVSLLGEALDMVRRHEAASVGGALEALHHPVARGARAPTTPPLTPLLDGPEALRQLIRDEVRAAVHEEFRAMVHGELRAMLATLPSVLPAPADADAVRLAVREELAGLRALPELQTPAPARRQTAGKVPGARKGKGASPRAEAPAPPRPS